jgi:hypothetical protein
MNSKSLKNPYRPIKNITLGLSVHRPEMIPYISECMHRHDAIFLEEPPTAGFEEMLTGSLAVDDYLEPIDVEYPDFSRTMCYLLRELKTEGKAIFQVLFLDKAALKILGQKRHLYGPGDQLTLLYVFHPTISQPKREAVLAARSFIYAKLITKKELIGDLSTLPHLRDELACIQITDRLSLDDCRRLFPSVRRVDTKKAHQIVSEYQSGNQST